MRCLGCCVISIPSMPGEKHEGGTQFTGDIHLPLLSSGVQAAGGWAEVPHQLHAAQSMVYWPTILNSNGGFLGSQFPNALSITTALDNLEMGPGTIVVGSSHPLKLGETSCNRCPEIHSGLGWGWSGNSPLQRLGESRLKQAWAESVSLCVMWRQCKDHFP